MHEMKPIQIAIDDGNGIVNKVNDVTSGSGRYKASKVVIRRKPSEILKIGTWNVRTMMKKREDCQCEKGDGEKWTKYTRIRRSSMERTR